MITHDGANVLNEQYGVYVKLEQILYMSGFKLLGLKEIAPLEIYLKHCKIPFVIPCNSSIRLDIIEAVNTYNKTYPNIAPFIIFYYSFINTLEVSSMHYGKDDDESKATAKVNFKDGTRVIIPVLAYQAYIHLYRKSFELDAKNAKKGF
jgi:hypothetical protein